MIPRILLALLYVCRDGEHSVIQDHFRNLLDKDWARPERYRNCLGQERFSILVLGEWEITRVDPYYALSGVGYNGHKDKRYVFKVVNRLRNLKKDCYLLTFRSDVVHNVSVTDVGCEDAGGRQWTVIITSWIQMWHDVWWNGFVKAELFWFIVQHMHSPVLSRTTNCNYSFPAYRPYPFMSNGVLGLFYTI